MSQLDLTFEEREGWELFNRLQAPWNIVVIDIRSFKSWQTAHIVNSINIPFDMNLSNDELIQLLTTYQKKKSKIAIGMLYYVISDGQKDYTQFIHLLQNLTHQHIQNRIPFYYLTTSFQDWYQQYPILCIPDMLNDTNSMLKLNYNKNRNNKTDEIKEEKYDENMNKIGKLLNIIQENIIIYRRYPACIIENKLYLGSINHAAMIETINGLNIGYIVNVTDHEKCYFENDTTHNIKYFRISINDQEDVNIKQYFENVFEFIHNGMQSDKSILVHCSAGISRSSTIVIAYIMKTKNITYNDARDYVKDKREVICPNKGFEQQLKLFQAELFPQFNNETNKQQVQEKTNDDGNKKECVIL